jgi:two-component system, sensor histidine kinase
MPAAMEITVADDERASETQAPPAWTVEALLDDMCEGFIAYDTAWRFTYINRIAEAYLQQFTQKSRGDLLGKSVWEAFPALVGSELSSATAAPLLATRRWSSSSSAR